MAALTLRIAPRGPAWLVVANQLGTRLTEDAVRDLVARGQRLARGASAAGGAAYQGELGELGRAVVDACLLEPQGLDGGLCLLPGPGAEAGVVWRALDEVPWEAACNPATDLPVMQSGPVYRALGAAAPEPLRLGDRPLKVLIIACNPRSATLPPLDVASARQPVEAEFAKLLLPPVVRVLDGPDTLGRLNQLLRDDPEWDVVHVIAHGLPRDKGSRIFLEDAHGGEHHLPYAAFAEALRKLAQPRLVTLAVCASSLLALEIALRHPQAWVVGQLHEVNQEALGPLFGTFYTELLLPTGRHEVTEAFRQAALPGPGDREWFLRVLYGPSAEPVPLFDTSALRPLAEVIRCVTSGDYDQAQAQAQSLADHPLSPAPVKARARQFLENIEQLRAYEVNLQVLDEELRRAGADRDWLGLQRRWERRDFAAKPKAGALAVAAPVVAHHQLFEGTLRALNGLRDLALAALRHLARFQQGEAAGLLEGCQGLSSYAESRPESRLEETPSEVFLAGVQDLLDRAARGFGEPGGAGCGRELLTQAQALIDQGTADPRLQGAVPRARARHAAAAAQAVTGVLDRVSTTLAAAGPEAALAAGRLLEQARAIFDAVRPAVAPPEAGRLQERLAQAEAAVRQRLTAPAARTAGPRCPPAELLQPGKRLALLRWLRQPAGEAPAAEAPTELSLDELLRRAEAGPPAAVAPAVDVRELPPAVRTAVANEAAPLALVTEWAAAEHPYLCLAGFGAGPNSPSAELRERVEFAAGSVAEPALRDQLLHALAELTDTRRRVLIDARLVPCRDPEECTRRLHRLAGHVLRGEPVPDEVFDGPLAKSDRAALLAAAGRHVEASAEAEAAVAEKPRDADALLGAYLLLLHDARLRRGHLKKFEDAYRRAVACLGMLLGGRDLLAPWVRRRFAVYQLPVPDDVNALAEAVERDLVEAADRVLQELNLQDAAQRALVGRLRQETAAELEGARRLAGVKVFTSGEVGKLGFVGGYLAAARSPRVMQAVGQDLLTAYRRLTNLRTSQEYFQYASFAGLTYEIFHELVFLFSEWRGAYHDPGAEGLRQLESFLPPPDELEAGGAAAAPGVTELAGDPALAARFPFHGQLRPDEREAVLSAHAALLAIRCQLEVARQELAAPAPKRARVIGALRRLEPFARHVRDTGYGIAGSLGEVETAIEDLLAGWADRVIAQADRAVKEGGNKNDVRRGLQEGSDLATTLAASYPGRAGKFRKARARLYLSCGCFLANEDKDGAGALKHLRLAYQCEPGQTAVLVNYLRAGHMHGVQLREEFKLDEGLAALREPVDAVAGYVATHPEVAAEVRQELDEKQADLRRWGEQTHAAEQEDDDRGGWGPPKPL